MVTLHHANGCELVMETSGTVRLKANATVEVNATALNVRAPTATFDGDRRLQDLDGVRGGQLARVQPGSRKRMVTTTDYAHPWMVTAPWYYWQAPDGSPRAGVPRFGRGTAPSIQKFASDDFVNDFLKDAQRSVVFDDDVDQVYAVNLIPASAAAFAGQPRRPVPDQERRDALAQGRCDRRPAQVAARSNRRPQDLPADACPQLHPGGGAALRRARLSASRRRRGLPGRLRRPPAAARHPEGSAARCAEADRSADRSPAEAGRSRPDDSRSGRTRPGTGRHASPR